MDIFTGQNDNQALMEVLEVTRTIIWTWIRIAGSMQYHVFERLRTIEEVFNEKRLFSNYPAMQIVRLDFVSSCE